MTLFLTGYHDLLIESNLGYDSIDILNNRCLTIPKKCGEIETHFLLLVD